MHECLIKSKIFYLFDSDYEVTTYVAIQITMYLEDLAPKIGI